ncbi:MAG: four helix bundle protein [Planctomycetes bacterium]|nr:four helix bundle protein [Planctomycetota bacterium]
MRGPVGAIADYKDLIVWQKSFRLCKLVFALASRLPSEDKYGLGHQLRKTSVSIPSNIAEGNGRGTRKDYVRFLWIARGSACELDTQLLLMRDITALPENEFSEALSLVGECKKMLFSMIQSLNNE